DARQRYNDGWQSPISRETSMATVPKEESVTEADEHTLPPFLRRVRIRGFRSIAFCDVALQPLTILVGRNAAGKRNFLDALAFLRDTISFGVSEGVKRRGGWASVATRTASWPYLEIEIEAGFVCGVPHARLQVDGAGNNTAVPPKMPDLEGHRFSARYSLRI